MQKYKMKKGDIIYKLDSLKKKPFTNLILRRHMINWIWFFFKIPWFVSFSLHL